jgi:hypothetical protein
MIKYYGMDLGLERDRTMYLFEQPEHNNESFGCTEENPNIPSPANVATAPAQTEFTAKRRIERRTKMNMIEIELPGSSKVLDKI